MTELSPPAPQLSQALLSDVQGNILRGFARDRSLWLFVRFPDESDAVVDWVANTVLNPASPLRVTSAEEQQRANQTGAPLISLMFSASGLRKAGVPARRLAGMDAAFHRGSRHRATLRTLNDRAPETWQEQHRTEWDALLLVACSIDDQPRLRGLLEAHAMGLASHYIEEASTIDEFGRAAGPNSREHYEHFGYRDALSQPVYLPQTMEGVETRVWDPLQPLDTVLAPDLVPNSWGSYFVFRKLRQDVDGFHARVRARALELRDRGEFLAQLYAGKHSMAFGGFAPGGALLSGSDAELHEFIKARVMGRKPNGEPLVGPSGPDLNDFDYAADQYGERCPFSAHIRKSNPRGATGLGDERKRIIARRSWPYGTSDGSPQDRGLLFLCAQSDIAEQFEFIQRYWGNGVPTQDGAEPTPGPDYLSGQPREIIDDSYDVPNRYARYAQTIDLDLRMYDFVSLLGAEYLFAPSLKSLSALVQGKAAP